MKAPEPEFVGQPKPRDTGDKIAIATKKETSARKPTLQARGPRHENKMILTGHPL
ncbi:MAG: hypothetical protein ACLQVN_22125 [Bryobacteraceae bacterium]